MPVIGLETQLIDFLFLDTNDPKIIVLLDRSVYLTTPEKPLINVIIPGFTGSVDFAYTPSSLIVITSDTLGLTYSTDLGTTSDLPDGVYQITMKVCPYDEFYTKKCYLKISCFQKEYEDLLRTLDLKCECLEPKEVEKELIDIEILIKSAQAECNICSVEKATCKYQAALKKLRALAKKLNC